MNTDIEAQLKALGLDHAAINLANDIANLPRAIASRRPDGEVPEPICPWCERLRVDQLTAELAEAREVMRRLLKSSDCSWYAAGLGHDWKEAVDEAEAFIKNAAIASGKGGE